jgi:hypothetical protein
MALAIKQAVLGSRMQSGSGGVAVAAAGGSPCSSSAFQRFEEVEEGREEPAPMLCVCGTPLQHLPLKILRPKPGVRPLSVLNLYTNQPTSPMLLLRFFGGQEVSGIPGEAGIVASPDVP